MKIISLIMQIFRGWKKFVFKFQRFFLWRKCSSSYGFFGYSPSNETWHQRKEERRKGRGRSKKKLWTIEFARMWKKLGHVLPQQLTRVMRTNEACTMHHTRVKRARKKESEDKRLYTSLLWVKRGWKVDLYSVSCVTWKKILYHSFIITVFKKNQKTYSPPVILSLTNPKK